MLEIQSILKRRNIDIDPTWIEVILGAEDEWLKTNDGVSHISNLIGFEIGEGKSDKKYVVRDAFGREQTVKHHQVVFLNATIVNGEPIASRQIDEIEIPSEACDLCGINSYCVKSLKDPNTKEVVMACNNCMVHNENPAFVEEGDFNKCQNCAVIECSYHPNRNHFAAM